MSPCGANVQEIVQSPSLELSGPDWIKALSNLVWPQADPAQSRRLVQRPPEDPSNLNFAVITLVINGTLAPLTLRRLLTVYSAKSVLYLLVTPVRRAANLSRLFFFFKGVLNSGPCAAGNMGAANPAAASSSALITGSLQHCGNNSERIKYLGWLWFVVFFLVFVGFFFVVVFLLVGCFFYQKYFRVFICLVSK